MIIEVEHNDDEDFGTLIVSLKERDDLIVVHAGEKLEVRLTLYAAEAAEMRERLKPLAETEPM